MDFSNALSDSDCTVESVGDLPNWGDGRTKEEMVGREARITAFFKAKEIERQQWIDHYASES